MVTLHVFFDKQGFFSDKAIHYIEKLQPNTHYYFFENISDQKKPEGLNIVREKEEVYQLLTDRKISKIVFHSLHYFQFLFLKNILKIRTSGVKTAWVFWSFEYYQLPFKLSSLYSKENLRFKYFKYASLLFENLRHFLKGNVQSLYFISAKKYFSIIKNVDEFYSFIEDDFHEIFKDSSHTKRNFLSYLDETDFLNCIYKKDSDNIIMLGHCGSPLLNHVEGFNKIQASNPNSKLLVPISYGNKRYIKHLKKVLLNRGHDTIEFLENRLQKEQYYSVLSSVSVFFLNSYCQQGLGNIVFFLLNGSTLYLSEKSTTFQFLYRKGFKVFSIESLSLDGKIILLSEDEKLINQSKIREMLEVNYVEKQWLKLISE